MIVPFFKLKAEGFLTKIYFINNVTIYVRNDYN